MSKPVTEEGLQAFYNGIQPYLNGVAHAGLVPVGTIIAVMGNEAPANYLICDGSIYNINDYPTLAYYFESQFESINYFGGDGITTFAVPDLQGEFLRGAGTNSHENQGSGGDVGDHQDGTEFPSIGVSTNKNLGFAGPDNSFLNTDSTTTSGNTNLQWTPNGGGSGTTSFSHYTSRPTNTSVLYCIAIKNIYVDASDVFEPINDQDVQNIIDNDPPSARMQFTEYSLNEQIIGRWIDGKPLYQKTIDVGTLPSTAGAVKSVEHNIANIDNIINITGFITNGTTFQPLPYVNSKYTTDSCVGCEATKTYVQIGVNKNQSTMSGYVTIQYTKTTDIV